MKELFIAEKIEIGRNVIEFLAQNYTMEVGVRNLERSLSSICRHCATTLVQRLEHNNTPPHQRVISHSSPNPNTPSNSSNAQVMNQLKLSSNLPQFASFFPGNYLAAPQGPVKESGKVSWCSLEKIVIDQKLVEEVLGPPKHRLQSPEDHLQGTGVAAGLVWTPIGGSIQYIECCITSRRPMHEQGTLKLTGQLGDVLEESAQIALSWIKSNSTRLDFPKSNGDLGVEFDNCDVHVHLPSGGIQKDGPSAGITLAVALISLFSGKAVRSDTAMTGELSLRGMVLPIGGLKEKLMAAYQAGLKRVIIPNANKAEIQHEVPKEVFEGLEVCPVRTLEDVLLLAFKPPYILKEKSKM